jgi:hypothetical protein
LQSGWHIYSFHRPRCLHYYQPQWIEGIFGTRPSLWQGNIPHFLFFFSHTQAIDFKSLFSSNSVCVTIV